MAIESHLKKLETDINVKDILAPGSGDSPQAPSETAATEAPTRGPSSGYGFVTVTANAPPEGPKTFISYARTDSEFALNLAEDLRKAGANIWMDTLDIAPGQRWDRAVQEALKTCPRIVVLLSPASVSSENVLDEVHYALDKGKDIIPLVLKDCEIPYRLSRLQRVDLQTGISGLLRVLGVLKSVASAPTDVGVSRVALHPRTVKATPQAPKNRCAKVPPPLAPAEEDAPSENTRSFSWEKAQSAIEDGLGRLSEHDGFIVVSSGDAYVQCSGTEGAPDLYCEAVGPVYLGRAIPEDGLHELRRLDFQFDKEIQNYGTMFPTRSAADIRNLAKRMLELLETVYKCPRTMPVLIQLNLE